MYKKSPFPLSLRFLLFTSLIYGCFLVVLLGAVIFNTPFFLPIFLVVISLGLVGLSCYFSFKRKNVEAIYLLCLVPAYSLFFVSIYMKGFGVTDHVFGYLTPKVLLVFNLSGAFMFFAGRYLKHVIIISVLLLPTVIGFDAIHNYFEVGIYSLAYKSSFYPVFQMVFFIFFIFILVCILILQRSGRNVMRIVSEKNNKLEEEKKIIKKLNQKLIFQANLHSILDLISKEKDFNHVMDCVLSEVLSQKLKNITNKGQIITFCSVTEKVKIVAEYGKEFFENDIFWKVGSIDRQFNFIGYVNSGYHVMELLNNQGEVIGLLKLYVEKGNSEIDDLKKFFEAVAKIISHRIEAEQDRLILIEQKDKILNQGKIINDALREVNDSVNYARYLQYSLLPNKSTLKTYFQECSILFLPKDKVSGDFYFAHPVENYLYFGVGDCTGHGVPGALLASMSIESVKNVIYEYVGEKPDFILEKLRKIATSRFSVNIDDKREDSMDAAICLYDKMNDKFYYSGGFINLYIVRGGELIEVGSTKCPVGPYPVEISYELNEVGLEKGDVVYLASDGFADQFGYHSESLNRPTKFKRKRFKELIKSISHLPTDEQTKRLNTSLNEWRGDLEQIDDVTMFVARH